MRARHASGPARAASLGAALTLAATGAAQAFDIPPPPPPMYQNLILPLFPNGTTVPFTGQSGAAGGAGKRAPPASPTLAPGQPQTSANARQLAQAVPPAERAQMARVYEQSFDTWRQLEKKLGLPANDVAGAVAAFIAGNYMAYRDEEVPDASYHRLVDQIRASLASSPGFAQASPAQRRTLYEQMAMVGTFMAVARVSFRQQPNADAQRHFRNAAAANLETALKVPADQVRISERGLVLP